MACGAGQVSRYVNNLICSSQVSFVGCFGWGALLSRRALPMLFTLRCKGPEQQPGYFPNLDPHPRR